MRTTSISIIALSAALALPATAQTQQGGQSTPDQSAVTDGAASQPGAEGSEIVVTGMRRSMASTRAIRRNSDQIIDAVVAEDIGKLPDVTASDSLARITGVQVQRGSGEAGQVLVRGLPNVTTTYNGRDIFTAEARFVAVQDFPAGGVAALEVYKSTTADLVESGIAGLINVRSRRPFDFRDRQIAGELRYTYASQSGEYNPNGSLLLTDRWQTGAGEFGALINLSYTSLQYLDSVRWVGGFIATMGPDQAPDPSFVGTRYGDFIGINYGQGDRERPSVNASLQWRPNADVELYADFLYQGFDNKVSDRQLAVPLFGGGARFSDVVVSGNQVESLTSTGQVRPELWQASTDNHTDTYQVGIGGSWRSGPWRISADLAATDSKYDSSIYSYDTAFVSAPTLHVNYNVPNAYHGVEFSFDNFDPTDPDNLVYRGLFDRHLVAEGDDIQFRTDVDYDTGNDLFSKVEFGLRFADRNASFNNGERYSYQEPLGIRLPDTGLDISVVQEGFLGSGVQQTRTWAGATRESIRENIADLRTLAGFASGAPAFNPLQAFEAEETTSAAYAQVHYAFGTTLPVDGVLGVRVVQTKESIAGNVRTTVNGADVFTMRNEENEYTSTLPTFSLRMRFSDDLRLRLAANTTLTRPDFSQLNPTLSIAPLPVGDPATTGYYEASGGNIDLEPIESTNYDITVEKYFATTGFATVGVFKRDVSGFIVNGVNIVEDPTYGRLRITQPINLDDTSITGVEAQVTTFFDFDFMPDWTRSFGIQVNATHINSDLPGISENAYNVVGMYENEQFSARLAYNTRSEWLNFVCEGGGNPGCEYTKPVSRLDFSASWNASEHVTLAFDASNILGEPYQSYREYLGGSGEALGRFPRDVRYEESIYSLALRFRY